jgi:hypothetical protein
MIDLLEAKDLSCYKKLLNVFGSYTDAFPATGVDRLLNKAIENGMRIMPKDKRAVEILNYILSMSKSAPARVQELLNVRFSDLPINFKPIFKVGNRREVAFWNADDRLSDKVVSLLDFEGAGKGGFWASVDRKKVDLVDGFNDKEE